MPSAAANGIQLEYERRGSPADPAILLIMGLGAPLTRWPAGLCDLLVRRGYQVIQFDNRDSGLSTKLDHGGAPALARVLAGEIAAPYQLSDMAQDATGLLDALGVGAAHLVGVSMGGMIAQLIAADLPDRALSLTSIMSSTGNPALPPPDPAIFDLLTQPRPDPAADMEGFLELELQAALAIASPGYPPDPSALRDRIRSETERFHGPAAISRQLAALWSCPDRRPKLASVTASTMVIHGADDPLIPVEAGEDTAASIPGARLTIIPGLAHDLPPALTPAFCDAICKVAAPQAGP